MKYQVLTAQDTEQLVRLVQENIEMGWKPLGGVVVDSLPGKSDLWAQAMTCDCEAPFISCGQEYLKAAISGCTICGEVGCSKSLHVDLEG